MLGRLLHWLCHSWERVRVVGVTTYERCAVCGKRRAWQPSVAPGQGWPPVDQKWVETGEWSAAPTWGRW